jgi:Holliday junction resolvase RusA-like endonuclease
LKKIIIILATQSNFCGATMKRFSIKTRALVEEVVLELSVPTSANQMTTLIAPKPKPGYASRRPRIVSSKSYKMWLTECSFLVPASVGRVEGLLSIDMIIYGGDTWSYSRDLDNTLKPTLDMLQKLKIISNDNTKVIRRITQEFVPRRGPSSMRVAIRTLKEEC